jgi:hypothetical protein
VPTVAGKVRYGVPAGAALGEGASLGGAVPFPRTDRWNRDVSQSSADPMSDALIASIGHGQPLRAAFGNTTGTPYVVVDRSQATVEVRLASSRLPRAWPSPPEAPVSTTGGRVIVVDRDAGLLYELLRAVQDQGYEFEGQQQHSAACRPDREREAVVRCAARVEVHRRRS